MTLEDLRNEFDRSVTDQIAIADRAQSVADAIANAPAETLHFRALFYHLLTTQGDAIVLALGRLFDTPPQKYQTRSIRAILALLEAQKGGLKMYRREGIEGFVRSRGGVKTPEGLSDAELTTAFAKAFEAYLDTGGDGPGGLLGRIRARRDKVVAHNEDWIPGKEETASWEDGRQLLQVAKEFAGLIGPAYLDFQHLAEDGSYMLTKQSQMYGVQAQRLIETTDRSLRRNAE